MTLPLAAIGAALALVPVFHEDAANPYKGAQLVTVAQAIQSVARDRDEAAFLITLGQYESGFSFRIHAGLCKAFECDKGRAASIYQLHQGARTRDEWHGFIGLALDSTKRAARAAIGHVRFARSTCRDEADPILATFRSYAGRGCRGAFRGDLERVATFRRVRSGL